jgi:RimJ/RimL family protein N-acetyltransferase
MFARTERLLLRPGWIEDAAELAKAVSDKTIGANLPGARWPTSQSDAESWLGRVHDRLLPKLLVFLRTGDAPKLVGGSGLHRAADGTVELDVWITSQARATGLATEAGRAMIDIANALGIGRISACIFSENAAATRLLGKLGFAPFEKVSRRSAEGDVLIPAIRFVRQLDTQARGAVPLLAA